MKADLYLKALNDWLNLNTSETLKDYCSKKDINYKAFKSFITNKLSAVDKELYNRYKALRFETYMSDITLKLNIIREYVNQDTDEALKGYCDRKGYKYTIVTNFIINNLEGIDKDLYLAYKRKICKLKDLKQDGYLRVIKEFVHNNKDNKTLQDICDKRGVKYRAVGTYISTRLKDVDNDLYKLYVEKKEFMHSYISIVREYVNLGTNESLTDFCNSKGCKIKHVSAFVSSNLERLDKDLYKAYRLKQSRMDKVTHLNLVREFVEGTNNVSFVSFCESRGLKYTAITKFISRDLQNLDDDLYVKYKQKLELRGSRFK